MNTEIISKEKNALLSREDVVAKIDFSGAATPSRKQIIDALASKLNAKQNLIVIKKIDTSFGSASAKVTAHVYDNEEVMAGLKPQHIGKRDTGKKAEGEAAAEAPKAEEAKE
ncbi:hypothetical protein KY311_00695 [Candidatus Woesearchaeota archaeon]|nr:hypothetical protein [Candidatus Woesearchaeota archaeon]MBW3017525.1 hypothetical protein [Candidatus Woesearchaeota archaeon]